MKRIPTLAASCLFLFTASAQWTPLTSGLTSIRSMTHVGPDLYAVNYPNGVKKSTDGGSTWNPVNTGLPSVGSNVFCESVGYNGSYLFAGTQSGIYRSNDGGASWALANGSLVASNSVYANKWFVNSGVTMAIFAGSVANGGGIWRTSNNGDTWFIGHSGMGSNVVVNHLTQVGNTLWASTSVGLYTSTDNAQNWTPHPTVNYAVYSLASLNNSLVIASSFGMRYSTNGGASWLDATGDPSSPTDGELIAFDGMLLAVLNAPTGCLRSMDNGVTWSAYNTGFSDVDAQAQEEFLVVGNTLYCTALFDVYALEATGNGLAESTRASSLSLFPTVFEDGFTVRNSGTGGTLILMDTQGRSIRTVRVGAGTDQHMDRNGMAAGSYRALFQKDGEAARALVGTVIAR